MTHHDDSMLKFVKQRLIPGKLYRLSASVFWDETLHFKTKPNTDAKHIVVPNGSICIFLEELYVKEKPWAKLLIGDRVAYLEGWCQRNVINPYKYVMHGPLEKENNDNGTA